MSPSDGIDEPARPNVTGRIFPWLAIATLLLLTRPFPGLYHDGYLYAAQTLARLGQGSISNDLIFAYGNQDSFTLFTKIYALVVEALGLPAATKLFWVLALITWGAALGALTSRMFAEQKTRFLAMATAILLAPGYGNGILSYAEPFITPRPFAEAAAMLAIAMCLRHQYALGAGLVVICGLLHPLTGIGAAALWAWLCVFSLRQYVALAVIGTALALGLAVFAGPPFEWLLHQADPEWRALMHEQSALVFVSRWGLDGLTVAMTPLVMLGIVLWHGEPHHAYLARSVLLVAVILVGISVLMADFFGNRLLSMLQLWRISLWPVLIGNLLAISAFQALPARSLSRVFLSLTLALNIVEHVLGLLPFTSAVMAVLTLAVLIIDHVTPLKPARLFKTVLSLVAALAVLAGATLLINRATGVATGMPELTPLVRLVLIGVACLVLFHRFRLPLKIGALSIAALSAILIWDARTPWQRFIDDPDPLPARMVSTLSGKLVYWEDALDIMWFKLKQPQFYSCRQKAGGLFFRAQAVEVARRANALRHLNTADFADDPKGVCPEKETPGEEGPTQSGQIERVCRELPELDLMVLRADLPGFYQEKLILPDAIDDTGADASAGRSFFVYDCDKRRN